MAPAGLSERGIAPEIVGGAAGIEPASHLASAGCGGMPLTIPSVRAILDRHDVTPGLVLSIQTFGSYPASFHPQVHGVGTDGAFAEEVEFPQPPNFARHLTRGPLHKTSSRRWKARGTGQRGFYFG